MSNKDAYVFLLADKTDVYLTEYLLQLDFEQYLYYQLKRKKYDAVFYIEYENNKKINVFCEDENSSKIYNKYVPVKTIPVRFLGSPEFCNKEFHGRMRQELLYKDEKQAINTISQLFRVDQEKYAFVLSGASYRNLLYEGSDLVKIIDSWKEKRHSIIIVETLNKTFTPWEEIAKVRWEPGYEKQIRRIIQRAGMRLSIPVENLDEICKYVLGYFSKPANERGKLLGKSVTTKRDLLEVLTNNNGLERLEEECRIRR